MVVQRCRVATSRDRVSARPVLTSAPVGAEGVAAEVLIRARCALGGLSMTVAVEDRAIIGA